MVRTFEIDGTKITDITSFYDEINRLFMCEEDWKLGCSLDALNDLLYGSYGALQPNETIDLIWKNATQSRQALGIETTKKYYLDKINQPKTFNSTLFQQKLEALEQGNGTTYFDLILEVFALHENIHLVLEG